MSQAERVARSRQQINSGCFIGRVFSQSAKRSPDYLNIAGGLRLAVVVVATRSLPAFPQHARLCLSSLPFSSFPFYSLPFSSLPFSSFPFYSLLFSSLLFLSLLFPSLPFSSFPFYSLLFSSLPFPSLPFPSFPFYSCTPHSKRCFMTSFLQPLPYLVTP